VADYSSVNYNEAIEAGPGKFGLALYDEILEIRRGGGMSFTLSAELYAFLGSCQSDNITGKSLSARFDDWPNFHRRLEKPNSTKIHTMRRLDLVIIRKTKHLI
jgi:hypothetical protein